MQLPTNRKIAAILAVDVAGYSAHAAADDAGAAGAVAALRARAGALAGTHGGRVFNTSGDGLMLEFASAAGALAAAAALLEEPDLPQIRAGLHAGDVLVAEGGDLLGHGVNVAARLEAAAEPGTALVSGDVRRLARGALAHRLVPRGPLALAKLDETIETYALLPKRAAAAPAPPRARAAPVLAVLPFDNLSDDADLAFFSDGVSEEILHAVSRAPQLKVIGRASSFQFRGPAKSVERAARELKASHILDGSVRKSGPRLRVAAQLIDAATQQTLWSDRFDRDHADAFALQDEIAAAAAAALEVALAPRPHDGAIDSHAFMHFLRARELAATQNAAALREAAALLDETLARAPHFAQAWGLLASVRAILRWEARDADEPEARRLVRDAADRALALDPTCGAAYHALYALLPPAGHFAQADALVARGLAARACDDEFLGTLSLVHRTTGRLRQAFDAEQRGYELNPLNPAHITNYANLLFSLGRTDEALALFRSSVARTPDSALLRAAAIWSAAHLGDWDTVDALSAPDALARFAPDAQQHFLRRALFAAAALRAPDEAVRATVLARIDEAIAAAGHAPLSLLGFAAQIGCDLDAVYARVERASFAPLWAPAARVPVAEGLVHIFLRVNARLREDARFVRLCARLGLAGYWTETGAWPDLADEAAYDFRAECARLAEAAPAP